MRRIWIGLSMAGLLVLLLAIAVGAQQVNSAGLAQPVVIDIEQAVLAEVMVAVPVDENEYMTVTTPIEVYVALRVTIDGPEVVTVKPLPTTEARITISALAAKGDPLIDENRLEYQIEIPEGIEILQMILDEDSSQDFTVIGELRNTSDDLLEGLSLHFTLYDADGGIIGVEDGYMTLSEVESDGTSSFELYTYDIPFKDVASYLIQVERW